MNKSVYIIIPVHNRKDFTRNCLIELYKQSYNNFKIIIIDDGSTDGTEDIINNEFPEVIIIKGDGNLWWTKATNIGVKYALNKNADYVLTLNNDVLPYEDYLEKLISAAKEKPNAIFGSLAIDVHSSKPIYGGEFINWKNAKSTFILDSINNEQIKGLYPVNCIPGRGMLIPTDIFKKIGVFDEANLKHYLADFDFSARAYRMGLQLFCNHDARIKIYPEESGAIANIRNKSIQNFLNHIWGIKGAGNIKDLYYFGINNCPTKYLLLFIPIGIIRRIGGYLRDWI